MKFCAECGSPLEDQDVFCPVCGTAQAPEGAPAADAGGVSAAPAVPAAPAQPVYTGAVPPAPPADKGRKGGPAKIAGIVAVVLAAALAVVLGVKLIGGLLVGPDKQFLLQQKEFITGLAAPNGKSIAQRYNELAAFSTDMTLTGKVGRGTYNADEINRVLKDSQIGLQVDLDGKTAQVGGTLVIDGDRVLSGQALYDNGTLGFQVPELDDTYYYAKLSDLLEEMAGVDLDGIDKLEIPQFPEKEFDKMVDTYTKVLATAVTKKNVTVSNETFDLEMLDAGNVKGKLYEYEPQAEDIEEMLLKLAEALEKDKDITAFVTKLAGSNLELINEALEQDGEDELEELLKTALEEAAGELEENAGEMAQDLEESGFKWLFWTDGKGTGKGQITADDGDVVINYETSPNGSAFWVTEYGYTESSCVLTYEKEGKLYSGAMTVSDGYESYKVRFSDMDPDTTSALGLPYGSFRMDIDDLTVRLDIGKGAKGGTDHTIRFDAGNSYQYSDLDGSEFTLNTSDKKSTLKKPGGPKEDISSYDEYDLMELFGGWEDKLQDIFTDVARNLELY